MAISCKKRRITAIFLIIALSMSFGANALADTQYTGQNQYAYTGFSGIYQQICVGERVVCQYGGSFLLSDTPVSEPSAQFLPRDMGDGSYAFENRSTEKRIAAAEVNEELPATLYNIRKYLNPNPDSYAGLNDDTQHWILEKAGGDDKYCLKSLNNDLYMGVSDDDKLIAVSSDKKVIFTFVPLYDESPLYRLSVNPGYERLSELQRKRLERVYESVAGDVFEQSGDYAEGNTPKSTPRAKIDDIYRQVSFGFQLCR